MKRLLLATLGLLIVAFGLYWLGCGEVDPALAPTGTTVTIIGNEGETAEENTYGCHSDWNIPDPCFSNFRTLCINMCIINVVDGKFGDFEPDAQQEYLDCLQDFSEATCADSFCDNSSHWIETCENRRNKTKARNAIRSKPGRCGYINYLVSAVVQSAAEVIVTEGQEAISKPMNNVEVRWVANGGDMYMPSDIPGQIEPLSNPYYDESDDRGLSEIKYRVPIPTGCGDNITYELWADIGVDIDKVKINMVVDDSTDEDDDDDDTGIAE